jgi:hypothetical protein
MSLADAESKMSNLLSTSKGEEIEILTLENLEEALAKDTRIKLAGVDIDGILRGKIVSKKKFLSVAKDGFGFCSVIFGCKPPSHFLPSHTTHIHPQGTCTTRLISEN